MTNPLQALITKSNETTPNTVGQFDWAEVVSVNPLYLVLDSAQDDVVTGGIDNLVGHLTVGQRVRVHLHGGRVYIYGNPALMRRMVQHGTSGGVNGQWIEIGASDNTSEPSFQLRRLFNGISRHGFIYMPGSAAPEIALMLRGQSGQNMSRLMLAADGKVKVNTYANDDNGNNSVDRPLPFATASGYVEDTTTITNTSRSTAITFPTGRFTKTPEIFLTPFNGRINATAQGRSANGFTAVMWNWQTASASCQFQWFAIQMEP